MYVTFTAYAENWDRNLRDSKSVHAKICGRQVPEGQDVYGVAVFASGYPRMILDPIDAFRLANQIADALTTIRQNEQKEQQ